MSDFTITIGDEKFEIQERVMNLIISISEERDYYHELLTYAHERCKLQGNYTKFQEIEEALKLQKNK